MDFGIDDQNRLLELQELDIQLAQARHRMKTMPIAGEVAQLERKLQDLHHQLVAAQTEATDLGRAITRSEEELGRVRQRLERDQQIAAGGAGSKLQQELHHELTSLARRISDLEDVELELMERQEELNTMADRLAGEETALKNRLAQSRQDLQSERGETQIREETLRKQRAELSGEIPPELLDVYERARAQTGRGAAVIIGHQCQACRLEISASELDRLATVPPERIEFCEECGAILVRAPQGTATA